jgi:hypothetical protein
MMPTVLITGPEERGLRMSPVISVFIFFNIHSDMVLLLRKPTMTSSPTKSLLLLMNLNLFLTVWILDL